eukprot:4688928-Prymnesium_polylepis.1
MSAMSVSLEDRLAAIFAARKDGLGLQVPVDELAVIERWDGVVTQTTLFKKGGPLTQFFTRDLEDDNGLVATVKLLYRTKRAGKSAIQPPSAFLLSEPHSEQILRRISALVGHVRPVNADEAVASPFYVVPPSESNQRWHIVFANAPPGYVQLRITDFFASAIKRQGEGSLSKKRKAGDGDECR